MFSLFRGRGAAWAQFERDLAEWERQVAAMEAEKPGLMPYFYLQDEDYITLKVRPRGCCTVSSSLAH